MGFLDDFFGNSARKDIKKGMAAANSELTSGEGKALGYYDQAGADLSRYSEGGGRGFDAYEASLGLRGADAQKSIQDTYFADPVQNALMDRITRANTRAATASGMGNSGAATQSLTNALLANYGAYQDKLKGLGDTGLTAAGATSTLNAGKGDLAFGAAQQRAGVTGSGYNAIAGTRNTGINNILGVLGVAAKAASLGGMPGGGGGGGMR